MQYFSGDTNYIFLPNVSPNVSPNVNQRQQARTNQQKQQQKTQSNQTPQNVSGYQEYPVQEQVQEQARQSRRQQQTQSRRQQQTQSRRQQQTQSRRQQQTQSRRQQQRTLQRFFENSFEAIGQRLKDFLLLYLISKDINADPDIINDELQIEDIEQIYTFFENNLKNKSEGYKNFFRRDNGQVIQVKTLLNREILPLIESLKNENNDKLFILLSSYLDDFKDDYGSLPNYEQDILTIGKSVLMEIENNIKNILSKQQQQQQKQRQERVLKQQGKL